MTKEKKSPSVKVVNDNASPVATPPFNIEGTVLALDAQTLRAIAVNAAATLFSAPQFTRDASPQNIIGMSELLYKYIKGEVNVNAPEVGGEQKFG